MIFKDLWHKYSAEHETRGALPNNAGTEFTIRIVAQANLGFRDFMKFQSHFRKFRCETCVFLKEKLFLEELNVINASFMWLNYALQCSMTRCGDMEKNLAW